MKGATGRTGMRTISMAVALLALGAGAALIGASCTGLPCGDGDCTDPLSHTCPWRCSAPLSPQYDYFTEHFRPREAFMIWVGDPRDAPDCTSANAYPVWDYYQDPKSIDRCPRCVAEPLRERTYVRITTAKEGDGTDGTSGDISNVGGFVLPVAWDGSCVSQRVILNPLEEDADLVWGGFTYSDPEPNCEVSLSPEDVAASWGTLVRVCERFWELSKICGALGTRCMPELAPGFRDCLVYYGDEAVPECPDSHSQLVQAHPGVKGCTWCEVEETGSRETTDLLTFYADERCTQPIPATSLEEDDVRYALPPGSVPRSVSATSTVERTAMCKAVGGEQEGELVPEEVVSFCCEPRG
ncbi:hypothetical protein [Sorangium sp. So ce887]|uniref:hypothetical protein n=1 Tax=Sorangium sp. So ce887 TaxID=3133324 RepID=UPI003F632E3A